MSENTTATQRSEAALIGLTTHISKAYCEVKKALAYSQMEGSEHVEEALEKLARDLESAMSMAMCCGRVWEEEQ